jgi:aspartate racemase
MKTIGLLGGMSWKSTVTYYRLINEGVRDRLGGLHSAKIVLWSIDFEPMEAMQREGRWEDAGALLAGAAASLERAGADFLLLCTNTMHKVAGAIEARVSLPLLQIADPTAAAIRAQGLTRVALLGTKFTMEEPFYRERLQSAGLHVLIPDAADRDTIHRIIYDELCLGTIRDASRSAYRRIIAKLQENGAEAVILGCTEIGLLIGLDDVAIPTFDTTALHARAAVEMAVPR